MGMSTRKGSQDVWTESAAAARDSAPVILRERSIDEDSDLVTTTSSRVTYVAIRSRDREDASDAMGVLRAQFGDYADNVLDRMFSESETMVVPAGMYVVYEVVDVDGRPSGRTPCAAFAIVLYECLFPDDGWRGSACMVDAFAVDKAYEKRGIGGQVFHSLLRSVVANIRRIRVGAM